MKLRLSGNPCRFRPQIPGFFKLNQQPIENNQREFQRVADLRYLHQNESDRLS
ncbi:MAG TPA: hypothetical protein V6C65_31800 [Allocoleopsis sp.]